MTIDAEYLIMEVFEYGHSSPLVGEVHLRSDPPADLADAILGYKNPRRPMWCLHRIWVKPYYRSCGHGNGLLVDAIKRARSLKVDLCLKIAPFGKKSLPTNRLLGWYNSHGFILIPHTRFMYLHTS